VFNLKFSVINFLFLFTCLRAGAQNLLVNTGFEELNVCEELQQQCSPEGWFNIRPAAPPIVEHNAVPRPFSGGDLLIVPVENVYSPVVKRPFVYTMFCCPLQKDKIYKLSFYLNTAGKKFYGIDFCLSKKEFISDSASAELLRPSIHISEEDVTNELNGWKFIETVYKAKGDEKFFLVGNLAKDTFQFPPAQKMNRAGDVFYFIDDISFAPVKPEPPCATYAVSRQRLYNQNRRHSEYALVEPEHSLPLILTDTVVVPGVYFETNKSILKPVFKKLIDSLMKKLADKNIQKILIEGHTDDRGTEEKNDKLSKARAESVMKYLLQRMPEIKSRIYAEGKGENFPKADNATEKGRAVNRRVEIILSYSLKAKK
jgi:outer membrane protein OmpA-like peptidoglycan-associated protein